MYELELRGAQFRPAESKTVLKGLKPGDTVTLECEKDNQYDPFAVRVIAEGEHIGYIPSEKSELITGFLTDGREYTATIGSFQSTLKPTLEIVFDFEDDDDESYGDDAA
jgi:hypothetical protein